MRSSVVAGVVLAAAAVVGCTTSKAANESGGMRRTQAPAAPSVQSAPTARIFPVDFTATLEIYGSHGQQIGSHKLYVGRHVVRDENVGVAPLADGLGGSLRFVTLIDMASGEVSTLELPSKRYRVQAGGENVKSDLVVLDRTTTCPIGSVTPRPPRSCERIGTETYDGREVVKWRVGTTLMWIDHALRYVVKTEYQDGGGGTALRDIRIGPVPEALFVVPAEFTKAN